MVIQQNCRKLVMMDILMSETCWACKKWNKIASDIKLVLYSSTITMMHGPINIRCEYMTGEYSLGYYSAKTCTKWCRILGSSCSYSIEMEWLCNKRKRKKKTVNMRQNRNHRLCLLTAFVNANFLAAARNNHLSFPCDKRKLTCVCM